MLNGSDSTFPYSFRVWAKSIGIYKENNDVGYIGNRNAAADNFAVEAWNSAKGAEKKKQFEAVSKDSQELLKDYFASAYANAKLNGMDDKEAFDKYDAWEFPKLQPGVNNIKIVNGSSCEVAIEYTRRYV